jgi:hypothetical protein
MLTVAQPQYGKGQMKKSKKRIQLVVAWGHTPKLLQAVEKRFTGWRWA